VTIGCGADPPAGVVLRAPRGFGEDVTAEILLSRDTFSIRYDMDRETGVISRRGHALEGQSLAGRIVYFPAVQGGVAAGWAFLDLVARGLAPAGVLFGRGSSWPASPSCTASRPILWRSCRQATAYACVPARVALSSWPAGWTIDLGWR
jgi:predicted aconitase with swiveling domain